jgi:Transglycosylase SLT domain
MHQALRAPALALMLALLGVLAVVGARMHQSQTPVRTAAAHRAVNVAGARTGNADAIGEHLAILDDKTAERAAAKAAAQAPPPPPPPPPPTPEPAPPAPAPAPAPPVAAPAPAPAPPVAAPAPAPAPPPPPPAPTSISAIIDAAFARYGPGVQAWAHRIAFCESTNNPNAVNASSGAAGLFQFLPYTWAHSPYAGQSPFNPVANANAAAWLYGQMGPAAWECKA